jgi:endo-1,3(4)-beta-glucanase
VTISGKPYPNGRNQESSSEAIAAYEAVALYGGVMADIFQNASLSAAASTEVGMAGSDVVSAEGALFESACRVRDMGRLLAATEIRSAITYWHVQEPGAAGVSRIYPDIYAPKVVGMMWSMLAQEQTWFGNEPWKSYGIQLMPITPVSEQRDTVGWLQEMLPIFNQSCSTNAVCAVEGWSILVSACYATVGEWQLAAQQVQALPPDAFLGAGGNGHSLSNTLWYIGTRPDVSPSNVTRHLRN